MTNTVSIGFTLGLAALGPFDPEANTPSGDSEL